MIEEDDIVKCPECNSRNLETDTDKGEFVCSDCGLVLADNIIDQGAEWRVFSPEQGDQRARTGSPMTERLHDKGLSTDIDWQNRDWSGKAIKSGPGRSQFYRMRKWQKRSRVSNSVERNLSHALAELDRISSRLDIPVSIREQASYIYRKCVENRVVRGRSIEGVTAASLYAACRLGGVPRTIDEIAAASRTGRKEIGRTYRFMRQTLKMRIDPPRPQDFLSRFCSLLGLSATVEGLAHDYITKLQALEADSGRGPTGLAAACIYIASVVGEQSRTQREVAEVAGVTEVTIRNRYKEIVELLDLGFSPKR